LQGGGKLPRLHSPTLTLNLSSRTQPAPLSSNQGRQNSTATSTQGKPLTANSSDGELITSLQQGNELSLRKRLPNVPNSHVKHVDFSLYRCTEQLHVQSEYLIENESSDSQTSYYTFQNERFVDVIKCEDGLCENFPVCEESCEHTSVRLVVNVKLSLRFDYKFDSAGLSFNITLNNNSFSAVLHTLFQFVLEDGDKDEENTCVTAVITTCKNWFLSVNSDDLLALKYKNSVGVKTIPCVITVYQFLDIDHQRSDLLEFVLCCLRCWYHEPELFHVITVSIRKDLDLLVGSGCFTSLCTQFSDSCFCSFLGVSSLFLSPDLCFIIFSVCLNISGAVLCDIISPLHCYYEVLLEFQYGCFGVHDPSQQPRAAQQLAF
jgi:hypothetical protein